MANGTRQTAANGRAWSPPDGIRLLEIPERPSRRFAVQWRVDGSRRTKTFQTAERQLEFAQSLAGGAEQIGADAYRLNPDEAREWRAFKAEIGVGTQLAAVRDCWLKHGAQRPKLTVRDAVERFTAAKTAEGVAKATADHYRPIFDRLEARLGNHDVNAVSREEIDEWVQELRGADFTRRTHQKLVKNLFGWLKVNRLLIENPCDGLKPVKIVPEEVRTWSVDEFRSLFEKNECEPPELLGRLACECFAGLRFSSAAQLTGADIQDGGIVLPAAKIKTRRRQYVDGLPVNLGFWLNRSNPAAWCMTPRQYLQAKSRAVVRAGLRTVHNACRHGFGTYAMAAWKDAGKVAAILCHTNQKMLWQHYKGRAREADGELFFLIYPAGACSPWPRQSLAP